MRMPAGNRARRCFELMSGSDDKPTVELDYDEIEHVGDAARLIDFGGIKVWIPFSQTIALDEDAGTIEIPEWLAKNEGLI